MSDEFTPNLGLTKPDVGASDDTWGEKLNTNFDLIDAAIGSGSGPIPPEYVTEAELTVILDAYPTDAELAATLVGYVTQAEFPEKVDDRVAALLVPGANITITYDDVLNTLTITSTASGGGGGDVVGPAASVDNRIAVFNGTTGKVIKDGGVLIADLAPVSHTHTSAQITDFAEATDDRVNALLQAGTGIILTYNDVGNQLTIASSVVAPLPATAVPLVESGSGAVGISTKYAREDHVHPAGGGGGGTATSISDTPPASPTAGQLWWESDTGILYIYYDDGTSSQWVAVAGGGGGSGGSSLVHTSDTAPSSPVDGMLWWRSTDGQLLIYYDDGTSSQWVVASPNGNASATVLRGYLAGLTLSTAGSSATFSVAAGQATDNANTVLMALVAALSKTTAAWAVGTGVGAWDGGGANPATTGATWFHVYLIRRPDTGVVDVALSQNGSAPVFGSNIPAAYTQYRRIGSMKTAAANVWTKFIQDGDRFMWDVPIQDVPATANPGTAAQTRTISTPLGVRTRAIVVVVVDATNASTDGPINIYVSDLSVTDSPPGSAVKNVQLFTPGITTEIAYGGLVEVMTNTLSQIRCRIGQSAAGTLFFLNTNGWFDSRGKDA